MAAIGRLHHLILDCPDPTACAMFYSRLLGMSITYLGEDFAVVAADDATSGIAFQLAPDNPAPTWPAPGVPQQMHLDVMVDDMDAAVAAVRALGAAELSSDRHVFADPAGHPFCLIPRPSWAAPVNPE